MTVAQKIKKLRQLASTVTGSKEIMGELQGCANVARRAKKLYATGGASMGKLHAGGRVGATGNFRLKKGEIVMNKTQQARLRKAKTAKGKMKVIADVKRRKPRKMKRR